MIEDPDGIVGPGEPGGLVGEVGQGDGVEIAVSGLVGGVDGGLPVPLGVGVAAGVEAQPRGAVREFGGYRVKSAAHSRRVAVLCDEIDDRAQVRVDQAGHLPVRSGRERAQFTGSLLQPLQQFLVDRLAVEGLAEVARLDARPVGGDVDQGAAAEYQEGSSVHAGDLHLSQGGSAAQRGERGGFFEGGQPGGPAKRADHGGGDVEYGGQQQLAFLARSGAALLPQPDPVAVDAAAQAPPLGLRAYQAGQIVHGPPVLAAHVREWMLVEVHTAPAISPSVMSPPPCPRRRGVELVSGRRAHTGHTAIPWSAAGGWWCPRHPPPGNPAWRCREGRPSP
ncbi:hypothetical protein E4U91_35695 [Streptomyces lasalocidi]|uniref:Uncharacterized protein n=1 Tax=Streptomyces lasalocidi TaxID=324833 RepID=A0A4U5W5E3_STRLS|nr:hypothetical protein E4U91_35695 [Streptomyces lasalocidi]